MWSIFNRKAKKPDLSWVHTDMHSHILPGLDDGAKDVVQSVELLKRLEQIGIQEFYFTPHIIGGMYPNTKQTISNAFQNLQKQEDIKHLMLGYAAEYMIDSSFDQHFSADPKNIQCLPEGYILIEMSYMQESRMIERIIFDLQIEGYKPILAHPERYLYYQREPKKIQRFKDMGCLLQLNLLSLIGYYGSRERQVAKYLLEKGMISLVGTDVHHLRHVQALEIGIQKENIQEYFSNCDILNKEIFREVETT